MALNIQANSIAIISDDLTGANDTGLQFYLKGCNTQVIFDTASLVDNKFSQAFAISTETRTVDPHEAFQKVAMTTREIYKDFNQK